MCKCVSVSIRHLNKLENTNTADTIYTVTDFLKPTLKLFATEENSHNI